MKLQTPIKIFSTLAILLLLIFSLSCDGSFHTCGVVYEWINPPDGEIGKVSKVYNEPGEPPGDLELVPLQFAQISFFDRAGSQSPGCSIPSSNFEKNRNLDAMSDSNGRFDTGSIVSPGKYPMKIVVHRTGYYSVEREFEFNGSSVQNGNFIIILVPEP